MSDVPPAPTDRFFTILGTGSAVLHLAIFTGLGDLTLENLPYGAIAGLCAGVGTYLFLPWFLRLSAIQADADDDLPFEEILHQTGGNPQLSATGLGLELGGITMFAVGLALPEPTLLPGVLAAIAVSASVSLAAFALRKR